MVLPKFCAKLAGYQGVGASVGARCIRRAILLADTLNAFEPVGVGMAVEGVRQAMIDTGCVQAMQSFVNSYTA